MRRTGSGRTTGARPAAAAVWGSMLAFLATGCIGMPAGGSPQRVEIPQVPGAENLQVRVYPVAPYKGESPGELLAGFLDASNADEPTFSTARTYLTAAAGAKWDPEAGVSVLDNQGRTRPSVQEGATTVDIDVNGDLVGALDSRDSYRPAAEGEQYRQTFTLVKETEGENKGEWRIDKLPNGLIADQTTFKNGYKAVHRYFFALTDPSSDRSRGESVLVPDPIFLRRRIDPLTAAAKALAAGPSGWLAPAVYSAFDGVKIVGPVTVSDNKTATVKVDVPDFAGRSDLCQQMAGQLYHTLADQQGKAPIQRLELSGAKGGCAITADQAGRIAPGSLAGSYGASQYYQLDNGQVMVAPGDGLGHPVGGPLGQVGQNAATHPGTFAVRRDGGAIALIGADGRNLQVVGTGDNDKLGAPVVESRAPQPGLGLTSPSWDGRGDLFVVDRDPQNPRVLMVRGTTVVPVQLHGLNGRTVQGLKVSSDGTRVALVLGDAKGGTARSVEIGLLTHRGTASAPLAEISGLRPVAPLLTEISSVSWADTDQLLVLGKEKEKLQLLHYLGTDGSQSTDAPLQVSELMTSVSASESRDSDQVPTVLAVSDHHIYRLQGTQWREVPVPQQHPALSFSYPG
ncbi:LpqB family beta-propeller domain-containing protein [Kitasatospora sp. NPDC048540]|uniref:LpqB family beta-propeller domain-containing protein n=1 Tax=unclassified Kitasatospora TaxID=2633591 RepID=UPI000A8238FB|nr:LpqB family beta-propeller domain-containing protein [Kitasatospora sp. MBT63]